MKINDDVTVVLRHADNAKPSRLVQTFVNMVYRSGRFVANDDDRPIHDPKDEGRTWVRGHVTEDSEEGKKLLGAALLADREVRDGEVA